MTEDETETVVEHLASYHRCLVTKCAGDMAEGWNTGCLFIGMEGTFVFVRFYREDMVDAGIIEAHLSNRIAYYSLYESSFTTEQMLFEDAMKSWKKERIGVATTGELELKLAAMGY